MNEHLNLSSNVQRNNKILDYKGEHQDLQLSSTSFNQNQTIESLLRDGNHIEKRIANDYLENILVDLLRDFRGTLWKNMNTEYQPKNNKEEKSLLRTYLNPT